MFGFGILSWLTFLPLVGAALILVVPGDTEAGKNNIRWIALWTTLVVFGLSLYAWSKFAPGVAGFQFVEQRTGSARASATRWAWMALASPSWC